MKTITIADLLFYCTESGLLNIKLYSIDEEKTVYSGRADEMPSEFNGIEIESFDPPTGDVLTINIA